MASYNVASIIYQALGSGSGSGPKPASAPGVKAPAGSAHPLMRCALSPDGRWLVAGAADGRVAPEYILQLKLSVFEVFSGQTQVVSGTRSCLSTLASLSEAMLRC